jgi:hypothetical protein
MFQGINNDFYSWVMRFLSAFSNLLSIYSLTYFETGSCYIAQAGLQLIIVQPHNPAHCSLIAGHIINMTLTFPKIKNETIFFCIFQKFTNDHV